MVEGFPMTARKDLRTSEAEYRSTDHTPRQQNRMEPETRHWHVALLVFVALAAGIGAARAQVNTELEALMVQQDRGWHGIGGDVQIQSTTVDARALPIIAVWTREPLRVPNGVDPYGHWFYVKYLLACHEGLVVPYALIDDSNRIALGRDVLGYTAPAQTPTGGLATAMRTLCSQYGVAP